MAISRIKIQSALQKPYNRILFCKEVLLPVFNSGMSLYTVPIEAPERLNKAELTIIDHVLIYGTIRLEDDTVVICYEIQLQQEKSVEKNRVAIQRYVRKLLTVGQVALINFISVVNPATWRLTLVGKDSELSEKGVEEIITHAKRYTYLLGPSESCKTAAERFENLSTESLIDFKTLVHAFSVEKLSKAFFDEYTQHYKKFCNYLQDSSYRRSVFGISFPIDASKEEKEKACKSIRDFTKKLLGRIVFLYFVQKKGWLGASTVGYKDGMPDFMMKLFETSGSNESFYNNWLSVLFFETLNKERENDSFVMPDHKKVKIPFLNGGLFDKEEYDEHLLTFPRALFHNADNPEEPKYRGFFDFLNSFNFTVHEDSPDDQIVAVDPEMLGHIFENLLEDNKDKGTYYTPKEIVHYMCQESLIEYLTSHLSKEYTVYRQLSNGQIELFGNETKKGQLKLIEELGEKALNRADVEHIVKYKDISKLTTEQLLRVGQLLDAVKICDPAIGSGAFPMGLLLEIYGIKEVVAYETAKDWNPVDVKENIIQNSVYGVDIEKGAVDIARLRFWLSLLVDEEMPRALPNLDYKIVTGNSLISRFDGEVIDIDWEVKAGTDATKKLQQHIHNSLEKLFVKQKQFFNYKSNKHKLQDEIHNLKIDLLINQLELDKYKYGQKSATSGSLFEQTAKQKQQDFEVVLQMAGYNNAIKKLQRLKLERGKQLDFFDWKLNFPEIMNRELVYDTGFDIVIGNPPYLRVQGIRESNSAFADELIKRYKSATGSFDLYVTFLEKGLSMINNFGIVNYIMPVKWTNAAFGSGLRQIVSETKSAYKIINFGAYQVFNASTYTGLQWFKHNSDSLLYFELNRDLESNEELTNYLDSLNNNVAACISFEKLTKDNWVLTVGKTTEILNKLYQHPRRMSDIFEKIFQGLATSKDDVYFLYDCSYDEDCIVGFSKQLKISVKIEREFTKPLLKGEDVHRYEFIETNRVVIFPYKLVNDEAFLYEEKEIKNKFPLAYKYLKQCELVLRAREKGRFNIDGEWFQFGRKQGISYARKEKLLAPEISLGGNFTYDRNGEFYSTTKIYGYIKNDDVKESYRFWLGLLNSRLFWFFIQQTGYVLRGGYFTFKTNYVYPFPVPSKFSSEAVSSIEQLVDSILESKKNSLHANVTKQEEKIDQIVYKLYNLSTNDIKIINSIT